MEKQTENQINASIITARTANAFEKKIKKAIAENGQPQKEKYYALLVF